MLYDFLMDYVMPLTDPFLHMQLRGVLVDEERRSNLKTKFQLIQSAAAKRLEDFSGGRKIMGPKTVSPVALAKLLYEDMGLPVQKHPRTGKPTTNEEALMKLASKVTATQQAAFNDILTVRDLGVLISTFLDAKLSRDGRLRTSYNVGGTETGRLSSSSSPWWDGTNMQNWHEDVREIVVADPGYVFVYGDGEQAEARVVAWLAQDRSLMDMFNSGDDIHKLMASRIFSIPIDQIDDDSPERYLAKRTVHAAHYGMGKRKFANLIGKPEAVAEALLNRYFAEFPAIKSRFQAGVRQQLERTRTLETPFYRRRQFFGRYNDDLFRVGYAYVPQATIADWLDIGLLRVWNWCYKHIMSVSPRSIVARYLNTTQPADHFDVKIDPAIQIHDGLLAQVPISQVRKGIQLMRECLTYEIPFDVGPLTVPVDIKIGFRWGGTIACESGQTHDNSCLKCHGKNKIKHLRKATPEWIEEIEKMAA